MKARQVVCNELQNRGCLQQAHQGMHLHSGCGVTFTRHVWEMGGQNSIAILPSTAEPALQHAAALSTCCSTTSRDVTHCAVCKQSTSSSKPKLTSLCWSSAALQQIGLNPLHESTPTTHKIGSCMLSSKSLAAVWCVILFQAGYAQKTFSQPRLGCVNALSCSSARAAQGTGSHS